MPTVKKYKARYQALDQQFNQWKALFKDINAYILPRRGNLLDEKKPYENVMRHDKIIDDTASRSNRTLGAGMQGGLASPSRPWFRLSLLDTDLANWGPVKRWLDDVENLAYKVFAMSNYYNVSHSGFEEQGGFGTSPMMIEEDLETVVRFRLFTAGEYRLATDSNGKVDTIYRKFWMTAVQMANQFGKDKLRSEVQIALDNNPYSYFQVLHCLEPRENFDASKADNKNMPWKSVWLEHKGSDTDTPLLESGFEDFPAVVPRWSVAGQSPYGFAPGHDALGNTKMLQEMMKTTIKALHKEVEPPMAVPSKFKDILSLLPGALNIIDQSKDNTVGPLYQVNLNLQNMLVFIQDVRNQIGKTYYNDLFLMIATAADSNREMTATEVAERHEEKLLMLGPTVERQIHENLDPTVKRVVTIMDRLGMLPPAPDELARSSLDIRYESLLVQAQKLVTAHSLNAHMTMVERVAGLDPKSAIASTDFLELLTTHGDVVGVPPKIARTKDEAELILAQLAQLEEQQRKLDAFNQMAGGLKDVGSASTASDTALGELKGALGA